MQQNIQFVQITPEELVEKTAQRTAELLEDKKEDSKSTDNPKKPMTKQEVADYFNVNLSTVYRWGKDGILSPLGVGGRVYFDREQVEGLAVSLNEK
ncbi:helix-turn-helix domain-containing protein [Aquimarina celericrescens]|uniref:Helix-turn-helix domain-containing protein n=1 Tax=Aquimarina celericrescens TaxID=1964542 RepID=A0ABW5ASP1_9FLAO|nr:helix-turn-helix domain-containing protein [Aquimarina celericrescens]